jgi:hypothetical protein
MNGQGVKKEEDKYIVLKVADVDGLSKRQRRDLDSIQEQIAIMRRRQGRPDDNRYIICNRDEPYAERVWNEILKGERAKVLAPPKTTWPPQLCLTVGCNKPATTGVHLKGDPYTEWSFCDEHASEDDVQDRWPLPGVKCPRCHKVLRSPDQKFCQMCGFELPPVAPPVPPATDTKEGP